MQQIISNIGSLLWGPPMIIAIMGCGILLTVRSKFFVFRYFGLIFRKTLGSMKSSGQKRAGKVSPFEAICVAVGGAVGVGSLGGVAAAIAVGGPGALFWILAWAAFGMTVKVAEVSLACHYRCTDSHGNFYGGPSYYIERGLGEQKGFKGAKVLAWCFGIAFLLAAFSGNQVFTIAEALNATFHIPMIPFACVYSLFVFYITWKGVPRIASFASKLVPFMCLLYFVGGIVLIAVIRTGIARSINSNEAGQGSSPMIHAAADTPHPVEQGLWGAIEVFVSTVLVSTITALAILSTGTWSSGLTSVTLTITAFQSVFGQAGLYFIGIIAFLFGITTTTGWFTYYCSLIAHGFRHNEKLRDRLILIFKIIFPWPNIIVVALIVLSGKGPNLYWAMIDVVTVLPTFFNVIALIGLSGVFIRLLNDYKARYLGVGTVDPNFHIFYEDEARDRSKD